MGTTRFMLPSGNVMVMQTAASAFPHIINGDPAYVGAPARVEDPANPLENLLHWDRYVVYDTGPTIPTSDLFVDVDLGADKVISTISFHGVEVTSTFPFQVQVFYKAAAGGYVPGSFIALPVWNFGPNDDGHLIVPTFSARYLRFRFALAGFGTGFSLGKVWGGSAMTDLLINYSPGSQFTLAAATARNATLGGAPIRAILGRLTNQMTLVFDAVSTATRDILLGVATQARPVLLIDQNDRYCEVEPTNDSFTYTHRFGPPDLWDCTLEVTTLP